MRHCNVNQGKQSAKTAKSHHKVCIASILLRLRNARLEQTGEHFLRVMCVWGMNQLSLTAAAAMLDMTGSLIVWQNMSPGTDTAC